MFTPGQQFVPVKPFQPSIIFLSKSGANTLAYISWSIRIKDNSFNCHLASNLFVPGKPFQPSLIFLCKSGANTLAYFAMSISNGEGNSS